MSAETSDVALAKLEALCIARANRRLLTLVKQIYPDKTIPGGMMNNSTRSILYTLLLPVATLSTNTLPMEWDLSKSIILSNHDSSPSTEYQQYIQKTNAYSQALNELSKSINNKTNFTDSVIFNVADKLTTLEQLAQTNAQKKSINELNNAWAKSPNTTELFNNTLKQIRAKELEHTFERFHNTISFLQNKPSQFSLHKNTLDEILQEIQELLPNVNELKTNKINEIKQTLQSSQTLTVELVTFMTNNMNEILSFLSQQRNEILDNSFVTQKVLAQTGKQCPNPSFLKELIEYIEKNQNFFDSFKIYLLQLMWWKEVKTQKNSIKNTPKASAIALQLRSLIFAKDNKTNILIPAKQDIFNPQEFTGNEQNLNVSGRSYRTKKGTFIRNRDAFYESNPQLYNVAILPTIEHNPGSIPIPHFFEEETNKQILLDLQATTTDSNLKTLLTELKKVLESPLPTYDSTACSYGTTEIPQEFTTLIKENQHFPLTKESLENPLLPENFKTSLNAYLQKQESATDSNTENKEAIATRITALKERKFFLENYISNISIHAKEHPYAENEAPKYNPKSYKNALFSVLTQSKTLPTSNKLPAANKSKKEIIQNWHNSLTTEITAEIELINNKIQELQAQLGASSELNPITANSHSIETTTTTVPKNSEPTVDESSFTLANLYENLGINSQSANSYSPPSSSSAESASSMSDWANLSQIDSNPTTITNNTTPTELLPATTGYDEKTTPTNPQLPQGWQQLGTSIDYKEEIAILKKLIAPKNAAYLITSLDAYANPEIRINNARYIDSLCNLNLLFHENTDQAVKDEIIKLLDHQNHIDLIARYNRDPKIASETKENLNTLCNIVCIQLPEFTQITTEIYQQRQTLLNTIQTTKLTPEIIKSINNNIATLYPRPQQDSVARTQIELILNNAISTQITTEIYQQRQTLLNTIQTTKLTPEQIQSIKNDIATLYPHPQQDSVARTQIEQELDQAIAQQANTRKIIKQLNTQVASFVKEYSDAEKLGITQWIRSFASRAQSTVIENTLMHMKDDHLSKAKQAIKNYHSLSFFTALKNSIAWFCRLPFAYFR